MFAAQMLMGGGPLGAAAGAFTSCVVAAGTVWAMRKRIPHPTESACIGCCYLRGGCHKHEALNLIIEVHEASNIPPGGNVYFYGEAGRFDCRTAGDFEVTKTKTASIFERLNLHVRQMDDTLTIGLWRSATVSSTLLGDLVIDVQKEIVEKDFPQMEWYTLAKEGRATVKVQISFHKVEGDLAQAGSPLLQYAMIKAQREAAKSGKTLNLDFNSLTDNQKLRFLSKVLEGPLKMLTAANWKEYYFKAVEGTNDRWAWKYWKSKQDCLDRQKAVGTMPLLAISTVLPDTHNRQQFYVKYYDKSGSHDVFFSRVDRDRDLWSDGLYEFLDRYRQFLQDNPRPSEAQAFVAEQEETKKQKKGLPFDPKKRRLLGPTEKAAVPSVPVAPKKQIPMSVAKMIEDAMTGYDELEEVNPDETEGEVAPESQEWEENEEYTREGSTGGPL